MNSRLLGAGKSLQSNEEAMANIFGYTTAEWRNDVKVHIDVIKRRQEEFNIGGLASGLRLRTMAQAVGSEIYFPEVGIDRVIKPVLTEGAGVVTTRHMVQNIVTEYGVASLRGKSLAERARALISIAHPSVRESLERDAVARFGHSFLSLK